MADIQKLRNVNVYLDGTNSLLGKAGQFTMPEVTAVTEDHVALGMFGKIQTPAGLDLLTGKVKWLGYYAEALGAGADPFTARKIQVKGSVEQYGPGGRSGEVPFVAQLTVQFTRTPLGDLVPQANTELEQDFSCSYVKVSIGGVEQLEIDVHNSVWRVQGVDLLAKFRANLGI